MLLKPFVKIIRGFLPLMISLNCLAEQRQLITATIYGKSDSLPIAFANVSIQNSLAGTFSDESGVFTINCTSSDAIIISAIGYETAICECKSQTVYLKEVPSALKELTIYEQKRRHHTQKHSLGYFRNKRMGAFVGANATAVFIENTKKTESRLYKAFFSLTKIKHQFGDAMHEPHPLLVRFLVFRVNPNAGGPGNSILYENITQRIDKNNQYAAFDIAHLNIVLPPEGLYIGIEFLGYFKDNTFIPFSSEAKDKVLQYRASFSKTEAPSNSWIRIDYSKQWKPFEIPNTKVNFCFGVETGGIGD